MTEVVDHEHSASSLDLYLGCPRRWVFERLYGFRQEDTTQKSFGSAIHGEQQAWIDSGKMPEHILAKRMLKLFAEHPYPPTPETTKAEEHFRMNILGVKWHGYTDMRRHGRSPKHRIVGDWKTTKDLKYALKADKKRGLLLDPETGAVKAQPVIYATREFVEGADDVTLAWAYGQSKDPWATRLVEVDVVKSACEDAYGAFHGKALEMNQLYQIRPKANDVPYRKGYCRAFNKPCEQSERCEKPQGVFTYQPLNLDEHEEKMREFLSTMKAEFPTDGVNEDEAPPPPVEDDDAPPPPPEDDEAPPPPDLEEHEAERLVAEYMASQREPRPAPTSVEAGFINAPEAKGKNPYATPEEAAIGEGVVPAAEDTYSVKPVNLARAQVPEFVSQAAIGEGVVVVTDVDVLTGVLPEFVRASQADALRPNDRHGMVPVLESQLNAAIVAECSGADGAAEEVARLEVALEKADPKPRKTRKTRAKKHEVLVAALEEGEKSPVSETTVERLVEETMAKIADDVAAMSIVAPVSLTMAELKQLIRDEIFKVVLDGCAK